MDRSMTAVVGAARWRSRGRSQSRSPGRVAVLACAFALAVVVAALALSALEGALSGPPPARTLAGTRALLPAAAARLPAIAQGEISGMLAADRPAYAAAPTAGGYGVRNRPQGFTARFDGAGVHLRTPGVDVGLRLQAIGVGSALAPVAAVAPAAAANRIGYERSHLREWYRNGPQGLEQGFEIGAASVGSRHGALTLALTLTGDARPTLARDGQSITLRHGASAVRYSGLAATDAAGRVLRSSMALGRGQLLLRIDARNARYPLTIDPWIQQGEKLTAGEPDNEARLGTSAALSGDGETLAVGGPQDAGSQGAVWVFARSGASWTRQAKLTTGQTAVTPPVEECAEEAADEAGECSFGASVALSSDGDTLLVGDPSAASTPGAAWVFKRTESGWAKVQVLKGEREAGEGRFGRSVALSSDGATALVGDPSAADQRGAAWVFELSEGAWQTQAALFDSEGTVLAHFGRSVALSGDGATALVGGPGAAGFKGAAWAFTRAGGTWAQQPRKLTGAGEVGAGHFGKAVALSGDGSTALIGGQDDDEERGAVWAFARVSGTFAQPGAEIEPPEGLGEGRFGSSLALSSDGSAALVGAPRAEAGLGTVVELLRAGSTWAIQPLRLGGTEPAGRGFSGASAALSSDGKVAAIGAPRDGRRAGAAWAFRLVPPGQVPRPTVTNVLPGQGPSSGGTTVDIRGSNFTGTQAVHFGNVPAASFRVVSQARITAVTPAAPAGRIEVTVTTPTGTSALSPPGDYFTFEPSAGAGSSGSPPPAGGTTRSGAAGGVLGVGGSQGPACRVSLSKRRLAVTRYRSVALRLRRTGAGTCRGSIALSYRIKGRGRLYTLRTIGTASFSLPAGVSSRVVTIKLSRAGEAWLRLHHGQANASLAIARVTPAPVLAQSASVRLSLRKARRASTVKH